MGVNVKSLKWQISLKSKKHEDSYGLWRGVRRLVVRRWRRGVSRFMVWRWRRRVVLQYAD